MRGSLNESYINEMRLTVSQLASVRQIGKYQGMQELFSNQKPEVLRRLKQSAMIESVESSNRIEGIVAPSDAIHGLLVNNKAPKNRNESEIAGYRKALDLLHESAVNMPVNSNVILQLHNTIYTYLPNEGGKWKPVDNSIIERNELDGSVTTRFQPVRAVETPSAMSDLTFGYSDLLRNKHLEPLLLIPLFILDFLCIHPFGDGNGRTARLLTLMLLYQNSYEVGRYVSLERIIEDSKESYYETLHTSSQGWHEGTHNAMPWIEYFWGVLIAAHKEYVQRVSDVEPGRSNSKRERVLSTIDELPQLFSIKDVLIANPDISREMIKVVIKELKGSGRLTSEGKGRGAKLHKQPL